MPQTSRGGRTRYDGQRGRVVPPHVSLGDLRTATGLTLDQVIERMGEYLGKAPSRGALSAIENGHRGASDDMLRALELAYGLREGAITTNYRPRGARSAA